MLRDQYSVSATCGSSDLLCRIRRSRNVGCVERLIFAFVLLNLFIFQLEGCRVPKLVILEYVPKTKVDILSHCDGKRW